MYFFTNRKQNLKKYFIVKYLKTISTRQQYKFKYYVKIFKHLNVKFKYKIM